MCSEVKALQERAEHAKALYNAGLLDRDNAKAQIMPYLNAVNERSKEIAKKYGQRAKTVNFTNFIR